MRRLTALLPLILCGAMDGGGAHTIVDGWVWGYNEFRQLCVTGNHMTPFDTGYRPVQVAAGQYHTLILWGDGTLTTCGKNDRGQLGNGSARMRNALVLSGVSMIADGGNHSLAVVGGRLYGWGDDRSGQLCTEPVESVISTPIPIPLDNVTSMDGGDHHSIFVSNGEVVACGRNRYGQLGNGLVADTVAAGGEHSLALVSGDLWSTGRNHNGQLCLGDTVDRFEWTNTGITGVVKVSAEGPFTALLMENGDVVTCGMFGLFQAWGGPFVDIAAGHFHLVMKGADGSLWSLGRNQGGQIGDGTTVTRTEPVRIR